MTSGIPNNEAPQQQYPRIETKLPVSPAQTAERMSRQSTAENIKSGSLRASEAISNPLKTHETVAPNPFRGEAKEEVARLALIWEGSAQGLAREPSQEAEFNVIADILLDEPEGAYDAIFNSLYTKGKSPERGNVFREDIRENREAQRGFLEQETFISAYMTADLTIDIKENMDWFMQHDPADIYERLSNVAFQTADYAAIQRQFSRQQRLGYRLAIFNFIRDLEGIKALQSRIQTAPPDTQARAIFGRENLQFSEPPAIQVTPMGFIVELSSQDYQTFFSSHAFGEYFEGIYPYQPPESWYSIIVVKKNDPTNPNATKNRQQTVDHELQHAFFNKFSKYKLIYPTLESQRFKQQQEENPSPQPRELPLDDLLSFVENTSDEALERVLNEVLAYATARNIPEYHSGNALGADDVTTTLEGFRLSLERANMYPDVQQENWDIAMHSYNRYFRLFRDGGTVFSQMLHYGIIPKTTGRQLTGKVDRVAFFSALLANDTHKDPFVKLHRYSRLFLHMNLQTALERVSAQRDTFSERDGQYLQRYLHRPEWLLEQQLKLLKKHGPNEVIQRMEQTYTGYNTRLIPAAVAWLQSERSQRFPAITNAIIPPLNEILFQYQDKIPIEQLELIQQTINQLPMPTDNVKIATLIGHMRILAKDILSVRKQVFAPTT